MSSKRLPHPPALIDRSGASTIGSANSFQMRFYIYSCQILRKGKAKFVWFLRDFWRSTVLNLRNTCEGCGGPCGMNDDCEECEVVRQSQMW